MLYSVAADIGFAHYPKTAGHSLTHWFRTTFPDAELVERHPWYDVNHVPVRDSLERLGIVPRREPARRRARGLAGACERLRRGFGRLAGSGRRRTDRVPACSTRIIGVVREPFEMLVSLFEYWRTFAFPEPPAEPLILRARAGNFREFLRLAVVGGGLPNYETFFDIGGPAAAGTRLLDFSRLEQSLETVCREFGIPAPEQGLGQHNAGPRRSRNLDSYREEAGGLAGAVENHFRWYYREYVHTMVRGREPDPHPHDVGGTPVEFAAGPRGSHVGARFPGWSRSGTLASVAMTGLGQR